MRLALHDAKKAGSLISSHLSLSLHEDLRASVTSSRGREEKRRGGWVAARHATATSTSSASSVAVGTGWCGAGSAPPEAPGRQARRRRRWWATAARVPAAAAAEVAGGEVAPARRAQAGGDLRGGLAGLPPHAPPSSSPSCRRPWIGAEPLFAVPFMPNVRPFL